jgi:hypothetical protein
MVGIFQILKNNAPPNVFIPATKNPLQAAQQTLSRA